MQMKISKVRSLLSQYLGLPHDLVFEDGEHAGFHYSKTSELTLTDVCLAELNNAVKLPSNLEFQKVFRKPDIGDYFLDLEKLVYENRLLVYKAIKNTESPSIILGTAKVDSVQKVGFNMDNCVNNANIAYLGNTPVTLLTPYIDSRGYVAVLDDTDRLMLVNVKELSNFISNPKGGIDSNSIFQNSNLGITESDMESVRKLIDEVRRDNQTQ